MYLYCLGNILSHNLGRLRYLSIDCNLGLMGNISYRLKRKGNSHLNSIDMRMRNYRGGSLRDWLKLNIIGIDLNRLGNNLVGNFDILHYNHIKNMLVKFVNMVDKYYLRVDIHLHNLNMLYCQYMINNQPKYLHTINKYYQKDNQKMNISSNY